jgi:hypothetical protein
VQRIAPRVIELTLDDYVILFRAFRALLTLGSIQS